MDDLMSYVILQVSTWASCSSKSDSVKVYEILYNWQISLLCGSYKVIKVAFWSTPMTGTFKFNLGCLGFFDMMYHLTFEMLCFFHQNFNSNHLKGFK